MRKRVYERPNPFIRNRLNPAVFSWVFLFLTREHLPRFLRNMRQGEVSLNFGGVMMIEERLSGPNPASGLSIYIYKAYGK